MKTLLTFFMFLLPITAFASFDRDLYYGLRNDSQVTELQEFLSSQSLYFGPITGNFFSLTQKAVKDFQALKQISSTGYFGPLTRAQANNLLSEVTDESGTPISPAITAPKSNDDVVAKLTEQLTVLMNQLAELKKNQEALTAQNQTLQDIKVKQEEQSVKLGAIQQNTVPIVPVVVPQIMPVDKSELIVEISKVPNSNKDYSFFVSVLNKSGEYIKDAVVTMDIPDNLYFQTDYLKNTGLTKEYYQTRKANQVDGLKYSTYFPYSATLVGTKTITFTSGNLTKSITIEVN